MFVRKVHFLVNFEIHIVVRDKGGCFLHTVLNNLYIIDLICSLRDSGHGCESGSEYCSFINYADGIVLISGSLVKMQFMLDICYNYGCQYDIVFNGRKSQFICLSSK